MRLDRFLGPLAHGLIEVGIDLQGVLALELIVYRDQQGGALVESAAQHQITRKRTAKKFFGGSACARLIDRRLRKPRQPADEEVGRHANFHAEIGKRSCKQRLELPSGLARQSKWLRERVPGDSTLPHELTVGLSSDS